MTGRYPSPELRAVGEMAGFGARPPKTPGIIASNLKWVGKGHLVASVDIEVPAWWIVFRGCLWHRWENGTERIFFAAAAWLDDAGERHFNNVVEFTDERVRDKFRDAALAAVHELAKRQGGRPGASPRPGGNG